MTYLNRQTTQSNVVEYQVYLELLQANITCPTHGMSENAVFIGLMSIRQHSQTEMEIPII